MDEMAKTLLACWLSLQTTEVRLNAGEESALEHISQQLHQHWEAGLGVPSARFNPSHPGESLIKSSLSGD